MYLLSISFENEYHDNIADFNIAISLDKEELKNLFEQIKSELDDYNLNSNVPVPVSVPVIKDAFDDFDDSFDENAFQKIEFDKEIKNKK